MKAKSSYLHFYHFPSDDEDIIPFTIPNGLILFPRCLILILENDPTEKMTYLEAIL